MIVHFAQSPYTPLAVSFAGLSTGYMIMGGRALFDYPPQDRAVERTVGIWAIGMPAVVQTISAIVLLVGITWFQVFTSTPASYVLSVAFMAYAAHWIGMGWTRYALADKRIEAWMGIPLLSISALACVVEAASGDAPVAIAFALLAAVYAADAVRGFIPRPWTVRLQGLTQFCTAWWLMYLVWGIVLVKTHTAQWWI